MLSAKRTAFLGALIVLLLAAFGCGDDNGTTAPAVPDLSVSATDVTVSETQTSTTVTVTPDGPGTVTWQIISVPEWLTVTPARGTISDGKAVDVTLTASAEGMPADTHTASLVLEYTGNGKIPIGVRFVVGPLPFMELSTDGLTMDEFAGSTSFTIYNRGNTAFSWSANPGASYVQVSPPSGTLGYQQSVEVEVTVDRNQLQNGYSWSTLVINTDFDQTANIGVSVRSYREPFRRLGFSVIDAEYDKNHDVIVAVSDNPPRLHIIDPETYQSTSVALPGSPTCVSVRPDGRYAGVGQDGLITTVKLETATVDRSYAVTVDVEDVVMAQNWWAYVFPASNQWDNIRCVNLLSREVSLNGGSQIFSGTVARLHPSGEYVYGANNGVSPSDFEKYDVRFGIANYLYDSPYHGDFSFDGNLWFSEDGSRIFARSGNIFRASTDSESDLSYLGSLGGVQDLEWVCDSQAANRIFAIAEVDGAGAGAIRVYDPTSLHYRGDIPLDNFRVDGDGGGAFYAPEGHFVFMNAAGSRIYALFEAPVEAGIEGWSLEGFDASVAP